VHFLNFLPSLYLLIFGFVWWIKLATITFERTLNLEAYHIVPSTCTPMGVFTRESSLRALVCEIDLPRYTSSLMDRFRRGEGRRRADLHKSQAPSFECGQQQTMNHIVDTCPLTKFEGGLNLLHEADDDAVIRLESRATAELAK